MTINQKNYRSGDIVAVLVDEEQSKSLGATSQKAFSCKVVERGIGITAKGSEVRFDDCNVLWVKGPKNMWPKFVLEAFNGRI